MSYKYQMLTLNFDLTRRCNLHCKFCARGESQNQDITPEVIDAALDRLDSVYVDLLRLSGGEPFLAPEMFSYLIDGIIERRLADYSIAIFTNGTIRDPQIAAALVRFAEYLEARPDIKRHGAFIERGVNAFYESFDNRIGIIVSESYHDVPESTRQDTIAYYGKLHRLISIDTQERSKKADTRLVLKLEGNARENIRELIGDALNEAYSVDIIDNRFCFIDWLDNGARLIKKSISISTDGNVFIGCFLPYDRIEKEAEFNVLNGNNLFDWLEQYCWRHPLPRGAKEVREHFGALQLCKEHSIKVPAGSYMVFKDGVVYADFLEKQCLRLHELYPHLSPQRVHIGAFALLLTELRAMGHSRSRLQDDLIMLYGRDLPNRETALLLLSDVGRAQIIESLDSTGSVVPKSKPLNETIWAARE